MADKNQQAYQPPTSNGYTRSGDAEATTDQAKELRRQKHKKWLLYGVAFVIFQTGIILLFTMTIMKVRNPKFRVRPTGVGNIVTSTANTSITLPEFALGIKNTNFGPYKYDSSTIKFYYGGTEVGSAMIPKSKAQFRRTKKFTIAVDLTLVGNSNTKLASDINSGNITLSSQAKLNGKVELMLIFKKKKAVNLDCTMDVNIANKEIQNIMCK